MYPYHENPAWLAHYERVDHQVSVPSDEQAHACLCCSSAAALLPTKSAEPRCVARVVPAASARAVKGHLLERASSLSCEPSRPTCSKKASGSSFLSAHLDSSLRRASRLNQSTGTHCCSQPGSWAAAFMKGGAQRFWQQLDPMVSMHCRETRAWSRSAGFLVFAR